MTAAMVVSWRTWGLACALAAACAAPAERGPGAPGGGAAAGPRPPGAAAVAADPLVERVVTAYGGRAALVRANAVRQRGRVRAVAQGSKEGALTRLFARPDSLRVEIAYPGEPAEVRIHHAGRGVRDGRDVTGAPPHRAMVLQAARLALPLWLAEDPGRARAAGRVERGGQPLDTLALDLPGGISLVAEVDAGGRVVRTVGAMEGPQGARFEFVNAYYDFRVAGGLLFAFREENFAGGRLTGETRLDGVEVLEAAPAGAFE
jgi:hypothetical protein